jgi:hypothetical protein
MQVVAHDDAVSILEYFDELEEPRSPINRQHLLGDLIVISVRGVLAGADGPKAIGVCVCGRGRTRSGCGSTSNFPMTSRFTTRLVDCWRRCPQSCFEQWIASLRQGRDGSIADEVIAIDGKALRRSHNRKKSLGPLFLVSAWSVQRGISLGAVGDQRGIQRNSGDPRAS